MSGKKTVPARTRTAMTAALAEVQSKSIKRWGTPLRTYFVGVFAFFILAQRAFCAAAILARPSALKRRRLRAGFALFAPKGKAVAGWVAFRRRIAGDVRSPIRRVRT